MKTRTFIAVEASPQIRSGACVVMELLTAYGRDYRWVAEQNLHFTLQFLGDLTDQEIVDVCDKVKSGAGGFDPFEVSVEGVGAFPAIERPKSLWVGVGDGGPSLFNLHEAIDEELSALGFRGENRRYVPHLTIGRLVQNARPSRELSTELSALADFAVGRMMVDSVTVFASQLRPAGPEYHVLARVTL